MKSIKILLPAAMTFAMFIGANNIQAQSASSTSLDSPLVRMAAELMPRKAIGLDYSKSLLDINTALTRGLRADDAIDFKGKVMINISLDASGAIEAVTFDKPISSKLSAAITSTLKANPITPVLLNGRAKAQTFNIPLRIVE